LKAVQFGRKIDGKLAGRFCRRMKIIQLACHSDPIFKPTVIKSGEFFPGGNKNRGSTLKALQVFERLMQDLLTSKAQRLEYGVTIMQSNTQRLNLSAGI